RRRRHARVPPRVPIHGHSRHAAKNGAQDHPGSGHRQRRLHQRSRVFGAHDQ
ncbi:unnamed protein product, partial [Heterosigma akashiwo]